MTALPRDPGIRIPFGDVAAHVARYCAPDTPDALWSLLADRHGGSPGGYARRWNECRRRGWVGEVLADRILTEIGVRLDDVIEEALPGVLLLGPA